MALSGRLYIRHAPSPLVPSASALVDRIFSQDTAFSGRGRARVAIISLSATAKVLLQHEYVARFADICCSYPPPYGGSSNVPPVALIYHRQFMRPGPRSSCIVSLRTRPAYSQSLHSINLRDSKPRSNTHRSALKRLDHIFNLVYHNLS